MLEVVTCLVHEHDHRIIMAAAAICGLSCLAASSLLARATASSGLSRGLWIAFCASAGGFGIWATHFIAMLAYLPGSEFSYLTSGTLLSLLLGIAGVSVAASSFVHLKGAEGVAASSLAFGLGVSGMHFVGMSSVSQSGGFAWNIPMAAGAAASSVLIAIPAFAAARRRGTTAAAALMAASILGMHFTAMAAVRVAPAALDAESAGTLPPYLFAGVIAAIAASFLFCGLVASVVSNRAARALAAEQANFRFLVQGVKDHAICMLDPDGRITNWNAGAERTFGYKSFEVIGKHVRMFHPQKEKTLGVPDENLAAAMREGSFETDAVRVRKDGTTFHANVLIEPIFDDAGRNLGFAKIVKDRTQEREADEKLRETSRNLELALSNMGNGLCLWNREGILVLLNARAREIFDVPREVEMEGRTLEDICKAIAEADPARRKSAADFLEKNRAVIAAGGGEVLTSISTGRYLRVVHHLTEEGSWVSVAEDVTERILSEERISYLVHHDSLTGLSNRASFEKRLAEEISSAADAKTRVATICIDLDRFKDVNDTFGHAAGDDLLKWIAGRLRQTATASERVARFGGDEFAVAKTFREDAELNEFAGRVLEAISGKASLGGTEILTGGSIGIAVYPSDGDGAEKLIGNADLAMYRAKESAEQKISFYEPGMDEAARKRRSLVRDIWKAVEEEQFHLAYQEQRDARTEELTGYEVLIRWNHPERGPVPPSEFIPAAEECGAISAIGDWVLRKACADAAARGLRHKIAVNLSPLQLSNAALSDRVRSVLEETGLPASLLELEVTESAIVGDKERALEILRRIKDLGVTVAIDDFGTGYSSLETLRSFPFDKIKLDKSFTSGLETSRQSKAFVRAIVALGKSLEVSVLAEGVETKEQMSVLVEEGCDQVQGFLFGKPGGLEQVAPLPEAA